MQVALNGPRHSARPVLGLLATVLVTFGSGATGVDPREHLLQAGAGRLANPWPGSGAPDHANRPARLLRHHRRATETPRSVTKGNGSLASMQWRKMKTNDQLWPDRLGYATQSDVTPWNTHHLNPQACQ